MIPKECNDRLNIWRFDKFNCYIRDAIVSRIENGTMSYRPIHKEIPLDIEILARLERCEIEYDVVDDYTGAAVGWAVWIDGVKTVFRMDEVE